MFSSQLLWKEAEKENSTEHLWRRESQIVLNFLVNDSAKSIYDWLNSPLQIVFVANLAVSQFMNHSGNNPDFHNHIFYL